MFHDLRARDLRFLGTGVVIIGLVSGLTWGAMQGPWAPGGQARADALLASGDSAGAYKAYLVLSESAWSGERRGDALWRAAQLAQADNRLEEAGALLERFVADYPEHPHLVLAHEARAELFATALGRPADAAQAWTEAARLSTELDAAGLRWLRAGRAWNDAGEGAKARSAFRSATASPASETRAWLSLANLQLAQDPAAAYDAYDRALLASPRGVDADVARLGMATAMERLDGTEAALAEVEHGGDSEDDALVRRRARLEDELTQ